MVRRTLQAVLCLLVSARSEIQENEVAMPDLTEEDDCRGGIDNQECTLSLRQLRAMRSSADATLHDSASPHEKQPYGIVHAEEQNNMTGVDSDYDPDDPEDPANNVTDANGDLGASYHHHHHGNIRYLYHQTSPVAGASILKNGFRRGHCGWCGGGIYFAETPEMTFAKARGMDSSTGFMIKAKVDLGSVKYMPPQCTSSTMCKGIIIPTCVDRTFNPQSLYSEGHQSISFVPDDGTMGREYVVYSKQRILEMWHVSQ